MIKFLLGQNINHEDGGGGQKFEFQIYFPPLEYRFLNENIDLHE